MSNEKILTNRFNTNEIIFIISIMKTDPIEAKKLEIYLKKYPKDYSVYPYYASILIKLGKFEETEEVLEYAENTFKKK